MPTPFVIAEAGVNHNGSLDRALELVDIAVEAGADAVKFQTFSASDLADAHADLAEYQRTSSDDSRTQLDLLRSLELTHEEFAAIRAHCDERGIPFLSTGFDVPELRFLVDELEIPIVKIASGDLTFAPLLVAAGETGLPTILSTGMADLDEIGRALRFLAFGYARFDGVIDAAARPTAEALETAWHARDDHREFAQTVTVLHCTTQYPASPESLNLRAMRTIAEEFGTRVGYSDHSLGSTASVIATTLGAAVIEKHFTADRSLPGPDHSASLDPDGLRAFVRDLRDVEVMLGSPVKECQPVEAGNRDVVRRSIFAARDIAEGATITEADLVCRRPAQGRTAFDFWEVVGTTATRPHRAGEHVG